MTTWTPERVDTVTRLWNEGLTTAEIGRAVGMSKNAVVGKAHRLQLPPRPSPIRRGKSTMNGSSTTNGSRVMNGSSGPRALNGRKSASVPAPVVVVANAKRRAPVPHLAIGNLACKWPIGHPDEPDFHFCGEHALLGKPYCMEHYSRAYVVSKPRSDAA